MSGKSKVTKHVSLRMPIRELAAVDTWATAHGVSRAGAVLHFVRLGMAAETGEAPATKADLVAFAATITKAIEDQPIRVQLPGEVEPLATTRDETEGRPWWRFWR